MKNYIYKKSKNTLTLISTFWLFLGTVQISQAQYTPWASISSGSLTSNLPSWFVSLDRDTGTNVPPTISFTSTGTLTYNRNGRRLSNRVDTIYTQPFNFLSGNVAGLQDIQFDFISSRSTNTGSVKLLLYDLDSQFVVLIDSLSITTSNVNLANGPNNLTTTGYHRLAIVIQDFAPNGNGNNTVDMSLDFTGFTTPQSLLPAQGCSFHATSLAKGIQLTWQNKDRFQNSFFEIERGLESFEVIGNISGLTLTDASKEFMFIDENPMNGLNLYRLKIIESDGSYSYSQVLSTYFYDIQTASEITLFPNPSNEQITVKGVQVKSIKIYTLSGLQICEIPQHQVLNIDFLENGNYILHIESIEGITTRHRFLKE
jgi:hypothetical protein